MEGVDSDEDLSSGTSSVEDDSDGDHLPGELQDISFGELEEIREKVGTKKFNSVIQNQASAPKEKKTFTRTNKNRPVERSSKQRVPAGKAPDVQKKKRRRDPRFDDRYGTLNPDLYKKSYEFLDSYREKEKKELRREGKRTKDENRKAEIAGILSRLEQRDKKISEDNERQAAKRETRKQQNVLLKEGKKPFYLKKGDQHKLEVAKKFAELKQKHRLEKFVVKKRQRNASRDRRRLPTVRDDD